MTPMIDLVFTLILYFLVTLSVRTEEGLIETENPSGAGTVANAEPESEEEDVVRVRIVRSAAGVALFFRDWPVEGFSALARELRGVPRETPIVLEAAPDVPFRQVVRVHNLALRTGHRKVIYTVPPAGGPALGLNERDRSRKTGHPLPRPTAVRSRVYG
jgi:biopolymer transport protein ExbD